MSELRINNITDRSGSSGPIIAGVSTVTSTSHMVIPSGSTETRPNPPSDVDLNGNQKISSSGGRGRGVMAGGAESLSSPYTISDRMQFIEIATQGNAVDFGDLSLARYYVRGTASSTRGVFAGGTYPSPAITNTIDYVTISSQGGANDFGDMSLQRNGLAAFGSETRGILAGGYTSPVNSQTNVIEFITIASTGDANEFGDLPRFGREIMAGFASPTRGIIAGGARGAITTDVESDIQFVTIASLGNSQRFGELRRRRYRLPGASNSTRGLTFGGRYPSDTNGTKEIDFITIATEGNAQDFGDLTDDIHESGALASQTRGINFGGETPDPLTKVIEFVNIATTGDAKNFGDLLSVVGDDPAGISDVHGGIGD